MSATIWRAARMAARAPLRGCLLCAGRPETAMYSLPIVSTLWSPCAATAASRRLKTCESVDSAFASTFAPSFFIRISPVAGSSVTRMTSQKRTATRSAVLTIRSSVSNSCRNTGGITRCKRTSCVRLSLSSDAYTCIISCRDRYEMRRGKTARQRGTRSRGRGRRGRQPRMRWGFPNEACGTGSFGGALSGPVGCDALVMTPMMRTRMKLMNE